MFVVSGLLAGLLTTAAHAQSGDDTFTNLSFFGDGRTPSGAQLLEQGERTSRSARYAVEASDRGDASYSVPIQVPAARLAPGLSLSYSSSAGEHTWVARGWSFSHDQVSIRRITGVEAGQAYRAEPNPHRISGRGFDGLLTSLDGITYTYTSTGTTEAQVTYDPGSRAWTVKRGGITSVLQARDDISWGGSLEPIEWFVELVSDANGNTMQFDWTGAKLEGVSYGYHCSTPAVDCHTLGDPPLVHVELVYGPRDAASIDGTGGFLDYRDEWLGSVLVHASYGRTEQQTIEYKLIADDHVPMTPQTRALFWLADRGRILSEVLLAGPDGNGGTLQRTLARMTYSDWDPDFDVELTGQVPGARPPILANGSASGVEKIWEPSPTQPFGQRDGLSFQSTTSNLSDWSGDGLVDAFVHSDLESEYFMAKRDLRERERDALYFNTPDNPSAFFDVPGEEGLPLTVSLQCAGDPTQRRVSPRVFADWDGDGRLDRIVAAWADVPEPDPSNPNPDFGDLCETQAALRNWTIELGTSTGFAPPTTVASPVAFPSMGVTPDSSPFTVTPLGETSVYRGDSDYFFAYPTVDASVELMDFNGDGWLDIVDSVAGVYLHLGAVQPFAWELSPTPFGMLDAGGAPVVAAARLVHEQKAPLRSELMEGIPEFEFKSTRTQTMSGWHDLNGDGFVDWVVACGDDPAVPTESTFWWCGSDRYVENYDNAYPSEPPTGPGIPAPAVWQVYFNLGGRMAQDPVAWSLGEPLDLENHEPITGLGRVDEGRPWTSSCGATAATTFGFEININRVWIGDKLGSTATSGTKVTPGGGPGGGGQIAGGCSGVEDFEAVWDSQGDVPGGAAQAVDATLLDYDGDGRVDFVDFQNHTWYRNDGEGFRDAVAMQDGYPHAMSETWSFQEVDLLEQETGPNNRWQTSHTGVVNSEAFRVMDFDRNGTLDMLVSHPYTDWDPVTEVETTIAEAGIYFGQPTKPGMLIGLEIESGALTSIEYTPSTYMFPAGIDTEQLFDACPLGGVEEDVICGAVWLTPPPHRMHLPKLLVSQTLVFDPVTRQSAAQQSTYYDGVCEEGVCQGFKTVEREQYFWQENSGTPPTQVAVLPRSKTATQFYLSRDHALPTVSNTYANNFTVGTPPTTDPYEAAALLPVGRSINTYEGSPDHNGNQWISGKKVSEYAPDGPGGTREWQVEVERGAFGHVEQMSRIRLDTVSPEESITVDSTWSFIDDSSHALMLTQSTSGSAGLVESGSLSYDPLGNLIGQSVCSGPVGNLCSESLDWAFQRTPRGSVWDVLGTDGLETFVEGPTQSDFLWDETVAGTSVDALGYTSSRTVDAFGRVITETDPNGLVVHSVQDVFGRVVEQGKTSPEGTYRQAVLHTYNTDLVPNDVRHKIINPQKGPRDTYDVLDGFGDVVRVASPSPWGGLLATDTVRDAAGNVIRTREPRSMLYQELFEDVWDDAGALLTSETYYDAFGLARWSRTDRAPEFARVRFLGAGIQESFDGAGLRKVQHTDTLGRLIMVEEDQTTTGLYAYDARGRIQTFVDGNGNQHRYAWDGAGRLRNVYRTAPGEAEQLYASYTYRGPYPEAMVLAGRSIEWDYDALGRTTEKRIENEVTGLMDKYTWFWDAFGNEQWIGALIRTVDPAGYTAYRYDHNAPDSWGLLTSEQRSNFLGYDGTPRITAYDYEFRPVTVRWPSTTVVTSTFNQAGFKTQDHVKLAGPAIAAHKNSTWVYDYDEWGQVASQTRTQDGQTYDWIRSSPNQLTHHSYGGPGLGHGDIHYKAYQGNGWLRDKKITPLAAEDFIRYTYDDLGRADGMHQVLESTGAMSALEKYTYDDAGNLVTSLLDGRAYDYDPVTRFGESTRRIHPDRTDEHTWDPSSSRMQNWTVTEGGVPTADRDFWYDAMGRLVQVNDQVSAATTNLWYGVDDTVVYEDQAGTIIERMPGVRLENGTLVTEEILPNVRSIRDIAGGTHTFNTVLADADGHAVFVFDADGDEIRREVTGIYGMPVATPNGIPWQGGAPWAIDGLHGSDPDKTNELVHFGVRHTLHRDGLWMQPEPLLAFGKGLDEASPSAFGPGLAGQNPLVYHDSTGWLQRDIYNESKNQITKGGEKALAEGDAVAKANPGFESGAIVYRNTATGELASGDFTSGGGPKGTWKSNSKQMNADLSTLSSDGSTWETAGSVHIHSGDNGSINYSSAPSTDDINNSVQDASGNNQVNIIMAGTSKGVGRQVSVLTVAQGTTGPRVSERTRNHAGVRQDLQKFSPAPTYLVGRVKVTDTAVKVLVQPASKGK